MAFIKFQESIKFEDNNAHTRGVEKTKYGGYTIPVELDDKTASSIYQLFVDHKTNNKFYGTTLYLKTKVLSVENKKDLLNKGNQDILIHFEATGVYTKDGRIYLIFEVTKLHKLSNPDDDGIKQE